MNDFVSVIIPVFNDSEAIYNTLDSLNEQVYPKDKYEVIVIDNGSKDNTIELIKQFENVTLLVEHINLNSPYSARNRGIEKAKGDIIALLDSTCLPDKNWLLNGVRCLQEEDIDIIGGNVKFRFNGEMTAAKIYDSITNIRMKESIFERQVAKTANLFIRKNVFDKIGYFPERVRSGADVRWTRKATNSGIKIIFCEGALVFKSARPFLELIKKQWRVGLAQPLIWKEEGKSLNIIKSFFAILKPIKPNDIKVAINKRGLPEMEKYIFQLLVVGQVIKIVTGIANCIGMFKIRNNNVQ